MGFPQQTTSAPAGIFSYAVGTMFAVDAQSMIVVQRCFVHLRDVIV